MPRAANAVCNELGCPQIIKSGQGKCPVHRRAADKKRGTSTERGYGAGHRQLRAIWQKRVATGTVLCARCQQLIVPNTPWDLDHSDDRSSYIGPSHATCNRAAAGRASHQYR